MSPKVSQSVQPPAFSIATTPSTVCAISFAGAPPPAAARSAVNPSGAASRQSARSQGRAVPESTGICSSGEGVVAPSRNAAEPRSTRNSAG